MRPSGKPILTLNFSGNLNELLQGHMIRDPWPGFHHEWWCQFVEKRFANHSKYANDTPYPSTNISPKKSLDICTLSKQLICIRCSCSSGSFEQRWKTQSHKAAVISITCNHPIRKGVQLKNLAFSAAAPTYMMPHGVPSAGDWALDRYSAVFLQGTQKTLIDGCTWTRKWKLQN